MAELCRKRQNTQRTRAATSTKAIALAFAEAQTQWRLRQHSDHPHPIIVTATVIHGGALPTATGVHLALKQGCLDIQEVPGIKTVVVHQYDTSAGCQGVELEPIDAVRAMGIGKCSISAQDTNVCVNDEDTRALVSTDIKASAACSDTEEHAYFAKLHSECYIECNGTSAVTIQWAVFLTDHGFSDALSRILLPLLDAAMNCGLTTTAEGVQRAAVQSLMSKAS